MDYILPVDLYKDWKELDFAKEVAKNLFNELKTIKLENNKKQMN